MGKKTFSGTAPDRVQGAGDPRPSVTRLVQIAAVQTGPNSHSLYGLDVSGRVWFKIACHPWRLLDDTAEAS